MLVRGLEVRPRPQGGVGVSLQFKVSDQLYKQIWGIKGNQRKIKKKVPKVKKKRRIPEN